MSRRRGLALATAGMLAGLVAMPAVLLTPVQAAAKNAELDVYGASAESYGLDVRILPLSGFQVPVVQPGVLPDIADFYFPHTFAKIDSLPHANADGEFFDPGGTVRVGPNLGNFFIGSPETLYPGLPQTPALPPVLPNYPYIAQTSSAASDKRDVDAGMTQAFTPEPVVLPTVTIPGLPAPLPPGFGVGSSHAHADASPLADATGAVASVDLQAVTIGSSKGESTARQVDGVVTAETTSTLGDVNIAKVIHIASITVNAKLESLGPNTVKTSQSLIYSGVTVAGMPATIDNDGIHLTGSKLVSSAQLKMVTDLLKPVLGPLNITFGSPQDR